MEIYRYYIGIKSNFMEIKKDLIEIKLDFISINCFPRDADNRQRSPKSRVLSLNGLVFMRSPGNGTGCGRIRLFRPRKREVRG
jgi:hypothetical protein